MTRNKDILFIQQEYLLNQIKRARFQAYTNIHIV